MFFDLLFAGLSVLNPQPDLQSLDNPDVHCLAHAVYWETRGVEGQGASLVAEVVLNRVESDEFPDTICDVVYQPAQFGASAAVGHSILEPDAFDDAHEIAVAALRRGEPGHEAMFFINESVGTPPWARNMPVVEQAGDHIFLSF